MCTVIPVLEVALFIFGRFRVHISAWRLSFLTESLVPLCEHQDSILFPILKPQ